MPERFTEDEFVLILAQYFAIKDGAAPDYEALSDELRRYGAIPDPADPDAHRTPDGLSNVVGRFAAIDADPPAALLTLSERFRDQPLVEHRRIWDAFGGNADRVRQQADDLRERTPAKSASNPDWQFDELILALDLYLRWRPKQPPAGHPDLVELSDTLRRLPIHPIASRGERFRSPDSVRRKLADLTAPDPTHSGVATKGGEGVHRVWEAFADDPDRLAAAVQRIRATVGNAELPPPDEDELSAVEGRILVREHRARERDRTLVRKRKQLAKQKFGRLACEVCDLDFVERYGPLGEGFIEVHHTVPLGLGGERTTSVDDLALVCANCHRMIHRGQPMLTIDGLRATVRGLAAG